jgi:hypothetical protein
MIDLESLVPNTNPNWIVSKNMIYYFKYCRIPMLNIIEDTIWVSLDRRVTKQVLRLVKHLVNLDLKFYLTTRLVVHQKVVYEDDLKSIVENYIRAITDETFFDGVFDMGFDHIKNLTDFMTEYDCHGLFKEAYEPVKKHYLSKWTDYYTNTDYFILKREDIRDFIRTLERELKLSLLI